MSRRCTCRSHPCHRTIPELVELFRKHLMLPVKPETSTHLKHLKSMVIHRLSCFSYVFLLANSTCWPFIHFFPGQLNVLAYLFLFSFFLLANSTCWPFTLQLDGSHRLLLLAFPHAREILLEVLAIDSNRKLGAV